MSIIFGGLDDRIELTKDIIDKLDDVKYDQNLLVNTFVPRILLRNQLVIMETLKDIQEKVYE
jgi:hypothetical protein